MLFKPRIEYLEDKPLGRYENIELGGWQLGIDTKSGLVFHARFIGGE